MSATSVTVGWPAIERCLTAIRSRYQHALAGPPEGRSFSALGATLFVDQVRLVVVVEGNPADWTSREGKACLDNTSPGGCIHLAPFVGAQRLLRAVGVHDILTRIASGADSVVMGPVVARFVNLVVVEPLHRPDHEIPLWLAIAHQLASGRGGDDLHAALPPLISDHDVLHEQIPPSIPAAAALRPRSASRETWPAFGARLLAQIAPTLEPRVAALHDDRERADLWKEHEPLASEFIRGHLLGLDGSGAVTRE